MGDLDAPTAQLPDEPTAPIPQKSPDFPSSKSQRKKRIKQKLMLTRRLRGKKRAKKKRIAARRLQNFPVCPKWARQLPVKQKLIKAFPREMEGKRAFPRKMEGKRAFPRSKTKRKKRVGRVKSKLMAARRLRGIKKRVKKYRPDSQMPRESTAPIPEKSPALPRSKKRKKRVKNKLMAVHRLRAKKPVKKNQPDSQKPRESTTGTPDEPTAQTPQESPAQTPRAPAPNPALSVGVDPPPPVIVQTVVVTPPAVSPVAPKVNNLEMDPICEGCGMADRSACCLATFCPSMAVGEIAEAVGMDFYDACSALPTLLMSCCYGSCVPDCIHGCSLAQELRQRYNVNTHQKGYVTCLWHCVTDPRNCLMGVFCCAFALTQELRFARKVKAQPTFKKTRPVRQMMSPRRK